MAAATTDIANLLFRYADFIDTGNLEGAAALFAHARIRLAQFEEPQPAEVVLGMWRQLMKIYPCGTPRTKHLITNPIIEVDESAGVGRSRSYYTVLQETPDFPLQMIASGRYHDAFERVDGIWRYSFRDYSLLDHRGDLSRHLDLEKLANYA